MIKEYLIDNLIKNKDFPDWMIEGRNAALNKLVSLRHNTKYGLGMYPFFSPPDLGHLEKDIDLPITISAPDNVHIVSLTEALCIPYYQNILKEYYHLPFVPEKLPSTAYFLKAFIPSGYIIHVPKGFHDDSPITIDIQANKNLQLGYLLILADEDCQVSFIEKNQNTNPSTYLAALATNIIAQDNAKVEYTRLHKSVAPHFVLQSTTIGNNAEVTFLDANQGSTLAQADIRTTLVGEKSRVKHMHMIRLEKEQKYDVFSAIHHQGSHSHSEMLSKTILNDSSHAIYRGLTNINQDAMDAVASQKEDTLLLGEKAKIDTVPMLEIQNDLVQAHHSTAITHINAEQLFYLQSRGLSTPESKEIIMQGFLAPVWERISCKAARAILLS
ncbi:MAG: hypothetical protein A2V81_04845 [Candidatus Abawacabacteria bacterium RBG_16_42_10]|uniref:SUF system FeS cluster assembly SufBD core domain-containing protein n=1 Tax=Candidatus Abawacabacteria bacterium RBG_16_42_10 TaxID=1817814 RepID=A0A1F4XIZ4_9BACT|nr:MAG: hypothetical protein A2V81_04845 [Candidatus Abawacabacteria bacterium RBG_16_42_10]